MFKLTNITIILSVTTCANFVAMYISWRRRKTRGCLYFASAMFATTLWTLFSAFDYAAVPIPTKVFFAKLETITYNSALVLFAWFALSYVGYENLQKKFWGWFIQTLAVPNIAGALSRLLQSCVYDTKCNSPTKG